MLINNETIVKDDDPIIRTKSLPVELPLSEEDATLLKEMFQYVKDSQDDEIAEAKNLRPAVGISAIQLGIPKQLTAVVVPDIDKEGNEIVHEYMLVNPRIVSSSVQKAYLKGGEGCLSVTEDHEGYIERSARIKVKAFDLLTNQDVEIRARNYFAIVLQHELDHFKGVLFYDYINQDNPFSKTENAIEL